MVLSQKTLTGGGNNDASTPPFTNAPISRYIAYKNCCPPTCDPNYNFYFVPISDPPLLNNGFGFNDNSRINFPPYGIRYNRRPCNIVISANIYPSGGFLPGYGAFTLVLPKSFPPFNSVTINGSGVSNVVINISDVTTIQQDSNGNNKYIWLGSPLQPISGILGATAGKYSLSFS